VLCLDFVEWDWFEIYRVPGVASEEAGQTERVGEGCERREHDARREHELHLKRRT